MRALNMQQPRLPFDQDDTRLIVDLGTKANPKIARRTLMWGIAVHLADTGIGIAEAATTVGLRPEVITDIIGHRSKLKERDLVYVARRLGVEVNLVDDGDRAGKGVQ